MKPFGEQSPTNLTEEEKRNLSWDEISKNYWWYEEGKRAHFPPSIEDFYIKQIYKRKKNALDIGGGTGKFAVPMSQDGLDVTLLEPSSGMRKGALINLEKAKNRLNGKVQVVAGESKKLNFSDESFDFILAKGSIHHNTWEDIQQSFIEAARVLQGGEFFIFQGRSSKDPALLRSELIQDVGYTAKDTTGIKKGVIEHYFTEDEIRRLGVENGLEIVVGPEEIIKDGNARWWVVFRKIN